MKTRNWPIRSKIIALVAAPIAALVALWIFATTLTLGPASALLRAQTLLDEVGRPGETLVAELQRERRISLVHLAGPGVATALSEQRVRTDRAVTEFRRRAGNPDLAEVAGGLLGTRVTEAMTALDALPAGRGSIDRREMDSAGALALYSSVIDSMFRVFSVIVVLPDDELTREARALTALGRAREVLGQSDALLAGAFTAGRFAQGEYPRLVQIIGTMRFLYAEAVAELPESGRAAYQRLTEGEAFVRLRAMEQDLIGRGRDGAAVPIDARAWQSSYDRVQQQLREFELASADALAERSRPVAIAILLRLGLVGVLGFLAVLISLVVGVRIGRSLVRRLAGLRTAAEQMATERLPAVVSRLRRGEDVDIAAETPALDYGDDEIGQVGRAFIAVQQTAVRSAVDEAALRRGLNDVFLNIARRSQALLHRQLALLDKMERRTTEPDELEDLFRVDHLATRMRRHAEDLVILAGAAPGRGWRNPVPMVDVVRGAISEVEEYNRVDIGQMQPVACAGRAVGDLVHLLAELIENAAAFSPPHTRVRVTGQKVPHGYAVEVEDRGLGMTTEALAEANRRLADPPEFDPANSARLGLFVVARLAVRHNIKVQLRPSPYGGVTAVVLIPSELIVSGSGVPTRSGQGSGRAEQAKRTEPASRPEQREPVAGTADGEATATVAASDAASAPDGGGAAGDATSLADAPTAVLPVVSAATTTSPAPVGGLTEDGLPRRIRQTNLAPQLRASAQRSGAEPAGRRSATRPASAAPQRAAELPSRTKGQPAGAPGGSAGGGEAPARPVRTPEEVRAVMAALQAGTARGRREAGVPDGPTEASPVTDRDSTEPGRDA